MFWLNYIFGHDYMLYEAEDSFENDEMRTAHINFRLFLQFYTIYYTNIKYF